MPRLVTLLGPGGIGKTRLALQVADEMLSVFPHGVWLVDLSLVTEATNLVQFVADCLGVRAAPGLQVEDLLVRYLRPRALLLVLDNCEHLAEECARLILHLLANCPSLRILVTSREALMVEGEALYPLSPLSFPNPERLPQFQAVKEYEAIQLFVERARLSCPGFTLQAENARVIVWICQRLDGIPLALELAAARSGLLSVEQIQAGLADYFHLLSVKRRTVLLRYQTMRASLDWSYNLLSPEERKLLCRLAVFSGGWTLEAAEIGLR